MPETKEESNDVWIGFGLFLLGIAGMGLAVGLVIAAHRFGEWWNISQIIAASIGAVLGGFGGLLSGIFGFFLMADS